MPNTLYGPTHQQVLRLTSRCEGRPFRPAALVALANLPAEQARTVADALEGFGFIERVANRKKTYVGYGIEYASGSDGQDAGVGYYCWVNEPTPEYRLTPDGRDEVERLARAGPAVDRSAEEAQALRTRLADVLRANEELRARLAQDAVTSSPTCPRCRQGCRRGSRHCHRCGGAVVEVT